MSFHRLEFEIYLSFVLGKKTHCNNGKSIEFGEVLSPTSVELTKSTIACKILEI